MAEELQEAEHRYPADWIQEAFREALRANVRNWKYIHSILKRWEREGKKDGKSVRDSRKERDPDKYIRGKYGHVVQRITPQSPVMTVINLMCPVCRGTKFIHPLLPSGEPDYSRLISCSCARNEIDGKRMQRLQAISNLGSLSKLTFDNLFQPVAAMILSLRNCFNWRWMRHANLQKSHGDGWL